MLISTPTFHVLCYLYIHFGYIPVQHNSAMIQNAYELRFFNVIRYENIRFVRIIITRKSHRKMLMTSMRPGAPFTNMD